MLNWRRSHWGTERLSTGKTSLNLPEGYMEVTKVWLEFLSVAGRSVLLCGYIATWFQLPRGGGEDLEGDLSQWLGFLPTPLPPHPQSGGGSSADCSLHPSRCNLWCLLPLSSYLTQVPHWLVVPGDHWRSRYACERLSAISFLLQSCNKMRGKEKVWGLEVWEWTHQFVNKEFS